MDIRESFLQPQQGKILRAPSLKRGRPEERISDRIKLEKVLGVTVSSNAALSSDSHTETVAYPAGCTVVLLSTLTAQQSHIVNQSKKTITSLAYSQCGRYLVTGECGHQPAVRVWDLQGEAQAGPGGVPPQVPQVAEFIAHKYGVNCVAFSPNGKYVVSIGSQHDMIVSVWDWKNNIKIASNKVSTKVKAVAFAENGSYFVTVGNRHVKFWYLEHGRAKYKEAVPLMGRSAILGEQRNNYFCDVACGKSTCGDSTYAITRSGLLCEFNNRRLLDKWVELRTTSANCMAVGEKYIFVGCAEGIVRCFDPATLRFVTTLPRTHYLGVDVAMGTNISHISAQPPNAKYPDAIAVTYDEVNNKLTVVYNDHSLYIWAVKDVKRVGKTHSFLYHSTCIWGVENSPPSSPLPPNSFITCSSDDTIRVWTLDKLPEFSGNTIRSPMYQKNVYSNELLKIVYVDKELKYLKDMDLSTSGTNEKDTSYDSRNGVRSIRLSPSGKHLASGDRAGNVRIHETKNMNEIFKIEAHDAEVLYLEYSNCDSQNLLASASRDRLIHVFDVDQGYELLQTLEDHSSSITAVKFLNTPSNNIQMVSCGADKSIIFRQLSSTPQGMPQFARSNNAIGKSTLYDMEVDMGQKHVLTACQDRNVRIYSIQSGKHTKTFKGSTGDDGSLIKVVLDRSGIYVATSCTDKTLSVYDYYSGECMATMCGHSELATGLRFTNDCRRIISASGDGCIFVWKVPHDMVVTMQARLSQQAMRQGKTLDNEIFSEGPSNDFYESNANSVDVDYSALPLWAKKQISDDTSPPVSLGRSVDFPKGRWAQRAEKTIGVKSVYTDSVISFPSLQDRKADSDGSKDSSIDSGTDSRTESRMFTETRTEISVINKVDTEFSVCPESLNELLDTKTQSNTSSVNVSRGDRRTLLTDDSALESFRDHDLESTAHDGDIEDISDQENRTIQTLYYQTQQDSASGSEFPVNAMDVDELRRSQKKLKRPNLPLVAVTTASVSGSQDSEDDDDEASTPSGEATDRNPMSMFSVSSESLDQIVSREKYLQSTFESLSGNELETSIGKTSISSQHHTRIGTPMQLRNMAVINAAKQIKSDPEATKKREELNKRIEETRKKLQSVGYRSSLKSSQSITDLSNVPERDSWSASSRHQTQGIHHNSGVSPNSSTCLQIYPKFPSNPSNIINNTNSCFGYVANTNIGDGNSNFPQSLSVPNNLQLCGCFMQDIAKNCYNPPVQTKYNNPALNPGRSPAGTSYTLTFDNSGTNSLKIDRPRRLKLAEKNQSKFKLHKSLPVSPVSEECRFSDFALSNQTLSQTKNEPRRSFSYFIDLDSKQLTTEDSLRQVCSDIQKFSQEFNQDFNLPSDNKVDKPDEDVPKNDENEDDGNFSSDSLEECSFSSTQNKKSRKKYSLPRRCYSNNEIYEIYQSETQDETEILYTYNKEYHQIMPKSHTQSFYLNPSNRNSRESILSDEYQDYQYDYNNQRTKSYCNSMESILSDESECKSAPLEVLFINHRRKKSSLTSSPVRMPLSQSSPVHIVRDVYQQQQQQLQEYENVFDSSTSQSNLGYSSYPTSPGTSKQFNYTQQQLHNKGFSPWMQTINQSIDKQSQYEQTPADMSRSKSLNTEMTRQLNIAKENLENLSPKSPTFKIKKSNSTSYEFQQKLLKFETGLASNTSVINPPVSTNKQKAIAYFIEGPKQQKIPTTPKNNMNMEIPSLKSKNLQYKSKYCNILNNRPEIRPEQIFGENSGVSTPQPQKPTPVFQSKENFLKSNTLESTKSENKNTDNLLQTTSLDRHILSKSLLMNAEKIAHKPPKAVRRHSSKNYSKNRNRKLQQNNFSIIDKQTSKTQVNFDRNNVKSGSDTEFQDSIENVIEINFKEKNLEIQCESSSSQNKTILTDIYDSLDKLILDTKIDKDSLENLSIIDKSQQQIQNDFLMKSKSLFEVEEKNVWKKYSDFEKITTEKSQANLTKINQKDPILNLSTSELDKIQNSIENIKLLHEIQQKIYKINILVDTYKANMSKGKVKILSKMYETLSKSQTGLNNFTELATNAKKYKRRNLSLPNFVERYLSTFDSSSKTSSSNLNPKIETKPNEVEKNTNVSNTPHDNLKKLIKDDLEKKINLQDDIKKRLKSSNFGSKFKTNFSLLPTRFEVHVKVETESSLRRACSLSDLSVPGTNKPKLQVSGKLNQSKPTVPTRSNLRNTKGSNMTRSSSTGVLNQSDSDQDTPKASVRNSLMRPTISSQNKVSNTKSNIIRRRIPQSLSTMNLSTVGQEDSSSEEASPNPSGSKPIVPPRPRSMLNENSTQPIIIPRRHNTAQKDKLKANRHTNETSNKENDVNTKTAQISSQLCQQVAEDLSASAEKVISLFHRISDTSTSNLESIGASQKQNLVKILENSVHKNIQILQEVFGTQTSSSKQNGNAQNGESPTNETIKKLNDLAVTDIGGNQTNVINFMHQYSDILLHLMQQKMASVNK